MWLGATILKSKDGEWQGLKLVVTGSSDEAIELLEKAADGSTRDELTPAEFTDVLAAKFDVTVTSSNRADAGDDAAKGQGTGHHGPEPRRSTHTARCNPAPSTTAGPGATTGRAAPR